MSVFTFVQLSNLAFAFHLLSWCHLYLCTSPIIPCFCFPPTVPKGYRAPVFLEPLEALLTAEGTVSLECKVVGIPTPVLKWFKDGVEIKAGEEEEEDVTGWWGRQRDILKRAMSGTRLTKCMLLIFQCCWHHHFSWDVLKIYFVSQRLKVMFFWAFANLGRKLSNNCGSALGLPHHTPFERWQHLKLWSPVLPHSESRKLIIL